MKFNQNFSIKIKIENQKTTKSHAKMKKLSGRHSHALNKKQLAISKSHTFSNFKEKFQHLKKRLNFPLEDPIIKLVPLKQ
jgi:hypothetical protein